MSGNLPIRTIGVGLGVLTIVSVGLGVGLYSLQQEDVDAEQAKIRFSPSVASVGRGDTMMVDVYVDLGERKFTSATIALEYDAKTLNIVEVIENKDLAGLGWLLPVAKATEDGTTGTIELGAVLRGKEVDSATARELKLATLHVEGEKAGSTNFKVIADESQLYLRDTGTVGVDLASAVAITVDASADLANALDEQQVEAELEAVRNEEMESSASSNVAPLEEAEEGDVQGVTTMTTVSMPEIGGNQGLGGTTTPTPTITIAEVSPTATPTAVVTAAPTVSTPTPTPMQELPVAGVEMPTMVVTGIALLFIVLSVVLLV